MERSPSRTVVDGEGSTAVMDALLAREADSTRGAEE
jgi:hypothetical protein